MKTLLSIHVRVSPRLYELGSVILLSSGINILTSSIGSSIAGRPVAGFLMIVGGVLSWFSGGLVARYREDALLQRRRLEQRLIDDIGKGHRPVKLPSVGELTIAEGLAQKTVRLVVGTCSCAGALLLFAAALGILLIGHDGTEMYNTDMKMKQTTPKEAKTVSRTSHTGEGAHMGMPRPSSAITTQSATYRMATDQIPSLQLDVHFNRDRRDRNLPAILFLHGGGLMLGDRRLDLREGTLTSSLIRAGFSVVSADYRLAPSYILEDIVADVQEAAKWVVENAGHSFPAAQDQYITMGESAGAYLSLLAGHRAVPKPLCIVSLWGYGDITGEWYTTPNEFFLSFPRVTKEEAFSKAGPSLYVYSRQTGTWPYIISGRQQLDETLHRYCPLKNVTRDFPPTFLVAGTEDQDVPYRQSTLIADACVRVGVECELVTIRGGGHGWDETDVALARDAQDKLIDFLMRISTANERLRP